MKSARQIVFVATLCFSSMALRSLSQAEPVSLQSLVTPSTIILKDGHPVTFAVHGFIQFNTLAELFPYIESQTKRWNVPGGLDHEGQTRLAAELLRRGIHESAGLTVPVQG